MTTSVVPRLKPDIANSRLTIIASLSYICIVIAVTLPAARERLGVASTDGAVVILMTMAVLSMSLRRSRPVPFLPSSIAAFGVFAIVSLALGVGYVVLAERYDMADIFVYLGPGIHFILALAVYILIRSDVISERGTIHAVAIAAIAESILGMAQVAGISAAWSLQKFLTNSNVYERAIETGVPRAAGTFYSWHALGGFSFMATVLLATYAIRRWATRRHIGRLALAGLMAAVVSSATAITASVVIAVGLAFIVIARQAHRAGRAAVLLLIGLLIAAILLHEPISDRRLADRSNGGVLPATISYRLGLWTEELLPPVVAAPIFGIGPDLPTNARVPYAESMYIDLLLRGGIVLLVAHIWSQWEIWRRSRFAGKSACGSAALRVSIPIMAVISIIHPHFRDQGVPYLFAIILALSEGRARRTTGATVVVHTPRRLIRA